ncbi:MAG TPA: hypothetical protein VK835_01695 [Bacteroidia bacterium]|nr:hypothetical protein [Bacteroidia bacterium]
MAFRFGGGASYPSKRKADNHIIILPRSCESMRIMEKRQCV